MFFYQSLLGALFLLTTLSSSSPLELPVNVTRSHANALTFRLIIANAVRDIQAVNPGAQLNRIECTSIRGPLRTPIGLVDVRLYFANPSSVPGEQAILLESRRRALAWGQWAQPR
ncbi:MAG: hypothetical protein Q9207_007547, partial [Kuettlingeria erythrocarpa]